MKCSVVRANKMDTVTGLIADMVARERDAPALIYHGESLSFASLEDEGRRAATVLSDLGVKNGDRVALWLPNCPAYLALCLGCYRLGAIAVAVNTRFRSAEVSDIIHRSGSQLLVMWPGFRDIDFLGLLSEADDDTLAGLKAILIYSEGEGIHELYGKIAHSEQHFYSHPANSN